MRKTNEPKDHSTPYRGLSLNMVKAPRKPEGEPKGSCIKANEDLRCKGGK